MSSKYSRGRRPDSTALWHRAATLFRKGDLAGATGVYTQLSRMEKKNPDVWMMLGVLRGRMEDLAGAEKAYRNSLKFNGKNAEAYANLAGIMVKTGDADRAIEYLRKALSINPGLSPPRERLGRLLLDRGDYREAEAHFNKLVENSGTDSDNSALNLLALAKHAQGKLDEAAELFRRVHDSDKSAPSALLNLGHVLLDKGACEEALDSYDQELELHPELVDARIGRVKALACLMRFDAAARELELLRQTAPKKVDELFTRDNEAIRHGEQVPSRQSPQLIFFELWYLRLQRCNWKDYEENLAAAIATTKAAWGDTLALGWTGLSPFKSLVLPLSPDFQLELARHHSSTITAYLDSLTDGTGEAGRAAAATYGNDGPGRIKRDGGGQLRIGYLSADFRTHNHCSLFANLFAAHDRQRFEVFAYSLKEGDGSPCFRQVKEGCDHFVDLTRLSLREAVSSIAGDGIDILVDLMGYTKDARPEILACRPAAIQVLYPVGYPATSGADFIDYLITDKNVLPAAAQETVSEQPVYMPEGYQGNDYLLDIAKTHGKRSDEGLPEDAFVYCCFTNPYKVDPGLFDSWMRVLGEVEGAVLWIYSPDHETRANLRSEAVRRGISGDRLIFAETVPKADHLARHRLADLFLDTRWYTGHTTIVDALWAGLPVLTCPGTRMSSRVGASLLHSAGLSELIAKDLGEYESMAVDLARDRQRLGTLRRHLTELRESCPLFNTARFARHLERAYETMWEQRENGRPPRPIEVPLLGD